MSLTTKFRSIVDHAAAEIAEALDYDVRRRSVEGFAHSAGRALAEATLWRKVSALDGLSWAISAERVQATENNFGQPGITVLSRPEYRIDLLYWLQNAAPRHGHVSNGAFAAVHGRRLLTTFTFDSIEQIDSRVTLGDLASQPTTLMEEGESAQISESLIHDLWWLEKPSMTISIRSAARSNAADAREYWESGVNIHPYQLHSDSTVERQLAALALMRLGSPVRYLVALESIFREGSASLCCHAVEACRPDFEPEVRLLLRCVQDQSEVNSTRLRLLARLEDALSWILQRRNLESLRATSTEGQLLAGLCWSGVTPADAAKLWRLEYATTADASTALRDAATAFVDPNLDALDKVRTMAASVLGCL